PGDRYIAAQLAAAGNKPIVAIVTKADKVPSDRLAEQLVAVTALGNEVMTAERRARAERAQRTSRRREGAAADDRAEQPRDVVPASQPADDGQGRWADIMPVSAVKDYLVDGVSEVLSHHLPDSPPLCPDGDLTDEPEAVMVGELVREA